MERKDQDPSVDEIPKLLNRKMLKKNYKKRKKKKEKEKEKEKEKNTSSNSPKIPSLPSIRSMHGWLSR